MQYQNRIHADRLIKKRGEPDKPLQPWIVPTIYSTVAAVLISLYVAFKAPAPVPTVELANATRLRELFFGGVPTAVFCSDSLSPKLSESISIAVGMDGFRSVRIAQVDCVSPVPVSSLFPQGKPLLEALGLVNVDGTAPSAFHATTTTTTGTDASSSSSAVTVTGYPFALFPPPASLNPLLAAHSLLSHALDASPARAGAGLPVRVPSSTPTEGTATADMTAACPTGRACLVLAAPGPLPAPAAAAAERIARRYRGVSVVSVDTTAEARHGQGKAYTLSLAPAAPAAAAVAAVEEAEKRAAAFAAAVAEAEAKASEESSDEAKAAAAAAAEAAAVSLAEAEAAAAVSTEAFTLPSFLPASLTDPAAARSASKGAARAAPLDSIAVIAVRPIALSPSSAAAAAAATAAATAAGVDATVARALLTPLPAAQGREAVSVVAAALDALAMSTFGTFSLGVLPVLDAERVGVDNGWARLGSAAKVGEGKAIRAKREAVATAAAAAVASVKKEDGFATAAVEEIPLPTDADLAAAAAVWKPDSPEEKAAAAGAGVGPLHWVAGPPALVPVQEEN